MKSAQGIRMFETSWHMLSEQKLNSLVDIVKKINTVHDLDDTLALIMDEAKSITNSEASSLLLIDSETKELYFNVATGGKADILKEIRVPPGRGIAGIVATTGESLIINDAESDPRVFKAVDKQTRFRTRNMICVPLDIKGNRIGVLEVLNKRDSGDYTKYDLFLLQTFADFAAIAIYHRELYQEIQNRAFEASALYRLSESINFCESLDMLLDENISIVSEVMSAERVSLILKQKDDYKILSALGFLENVKYQCIKGSPILEYIQRTGSGVFSTNIHDDDRFQNHGNSKYNDKTFVAVPLKLKNQIVAFLCVTERNRKKPYQYSDLRTMEMLAQQMMENYNHFKLSEEYKKKQMLESELAIAARIQEDILPRVFNSGNKLDVSAIALPAKVVGGDFYDFVPLGKGRFAVIIADVSGKGMPAGIFMAVSQSLIRAGISNTHRPSTIMKTANRQIYNNSKTSMFVTCFCCIIDTKKKELTYSTAGHMDQFLLKAKSKKIKNLRSIGKPLGIFEDSKYKEKKIKYSKGDLLFLYTDGLTDALNSRIEEYGEERLRNIVMTGPKPSSDFCNMILDDIKSFQGSEEQADDITMMAVNLIT